jgi:hypothetical protein
MLKCDYEINNKNKAFPKVNILLLHDFWLLQKTGDEITQQMCHIIILFRNCNMINDES